MLSTEELSEAENADEEHSLRASRPARVLRRPDWTACLSIGVLLGLLAVCLAAYFARHSGHSWRRELRSSECLALDLMATYIIENAGAGGGYLSVVGNGTGSGADVGLRDDRQLPSAQWRIARGAGGTHLIESADAGGLSLSAVAIWSGANVRLRDDPQSESAQWRIAGAAAGTCTIEANDMAGQYLSAAACGERGSRGAAVQLSDVPESMCAQWRIFETASDLALDDSSYLWDEARRELNVVTSWSGWAALPFVDGSTTATTTTRTATSSTETATTGTATNTSVSSTHTSTVTGTNTSTSTSTSTGTTTRTTLSVTSHTSFSTTTTIPCWVLAEGDECYQEVVATMYDLRAKGTGSRGALSAWSSFEEVQDHVNKTNKNSKCPLSCGCETARIGSSCYDGVVYARKEGIKKHPERYPFLNKDSSFEDFQAHLWANDPEANCSRPCRASWRGDPSVFCWSLARRDGYEAALMKAQVEAGAGIFSCDGFVVASEDAWTVGKGPGGRVGTVKTLTFPGAPMNISEDGATANALLSMNAWDAIVEKTLILEYDWAVKVDADAVVIANRLRAHLHLHSGQNVFARNCNKEPKSEDFSMMLASLEVLSNKALRTYADGYGRCKSELDWQSWGEAFFLSKCLPHLGVQPLDDFDLISDDSCTHVDVDCRSGVAAVFHPLKSSEDWMDCWVATIAGRNSPLPALPKPKLTGSFGQPQ